MASVAVAKSIDPQQLPGVVVDDSAAELKGTWTGSHTVGPFVNEGYVYAAGGSKATARFVLKAPSEGKFHILFSYTPHPNRSAATRITVEAAGQSKEHTVDQRKTPDAYYSFHGLGEVVLKQGDAVTVVIDAAGTSGAVVADAVQLLTADELKVAQELARKTPVLASVTPKQNAKTNEPKQDAKPANPPPVEFTRADPKRDVATITSAHIDAALEKHAMEIASAPLASDDIFLRRAMLDIAGRQPTPAELEAFLADASRQKRSAAIDRLLAASDYGRNWADYWSDAIGYRQQEPELTFHDYTPFKEWLAEQFNSDKRWDEIVYRMIIAQGKVGENPAGTFVAFHQADSHRLAGETSRVFLAVQIHCAECHDHPFIDMPQETFHGMAAFFTRVKAKIPWNDSSQIDLTSEGKGEHRMPGKKGDMVPTALDGYQIELGAVDLQRRASLARWLVSPDNDQFARAYVNRIWARLIGRGFCEPVDDMGQGIEPDLPELLEALADHFTASEFDTRAVMRVIMNTRAYQRGLGVGETPDAAKKPFAAVATKPLRGDEVFTSLAVAIRLPNVTPEKEKPSGGNRFPVPPKSTRDLVDAAFGYDPSFRDENIPRTMKQAMFMMNNEQLQAQINADPESGTYLAELLAQEEDNTAAAHKLYRSVLAREPTEKELAIVLAHLKRVGERGEAFEDILWSLINSTEFVTRR